jgi:predicted nucleotidyltransferase
MLLFYQMNTSKNFVDIYIKKAQKWANFLQFLPGVSAIFLSGSLAQGHARSDSDIDIFVIAKPGKIFTARFFINFFLTITRQLASEKRHAGRLCPNHFVTEDSLEIVEKDAYSANLFVHNCFLAGDKKIWNNFIWENQTWVKNFGEKFAETAQKKHPKTYISEKKFGIFEKILRNYQVSKIQKNAQNLPDHACIILTDKEIRLHPHPKNLTYLFRENSASRS